MRLQLMSVAILVGCQSVGAGDEAPPPPRVRTPHDDISMRFHMYRSFDLTRAIERLLVRGNLADAKALATSMAEAPEPGGLEPWGRQTALVRQRATAVAQASDLDEACRRLARLAEACASCHLDAGAVPELRKPPRAPADLDTVAARMARHRWAADRLWEGMIGNADEPWRDGLDVLAQAPLQFPVLAGDRIALANRLRELADQARREQSASTLADRARIHGEILVTCTACHSGASTSPLR